MQRTNTSAITTMSGTYFSSNSTDANTADSSAHDKDLSEIASSGLSDISSTGRNTNNEVNSRPLVGVLQGKYNKYTR